MITPIIFNPIENNPYFWWNGLEIPLQLKYIFEQLMRHDVTIKELVDAVNKFNEEFADTIKQEVVDKINEMYESGELANIVGNVVANSVKGKVGAIDLSHIGCVLHHAHNYDDKSGNTYNSELYSYAQGNNVFKINGRLYWAVACVRQNTSQAGQTDNGADIYIYRMVLDGQLEYVTHRHYETMGHCNGMCYHDGYLYIAPNSYMVETASGTPTTDLIRISFDGYNLGTEVEKHTEINTGTGTAWIDFPCSYNGELYFIDQYMNVLKYDWTTNTCTLAYTRINGELGYSGEGLVIDDNYIYFGNSSNYRIKRYNKSMDVIDWVYQLPTVSNNRMYKTGEIEGFSIVDGVLYVLGAYNLGQNILLNEYNVWRFYRQNLATNEIAPTNSFGGWSSGLTGNGATFYVSGDLPKDTDDPYNPTGLTLQTAFPCLQLALDYIESSEWIKKATVQVNQTANYSPVVIKSNKSITLSGTYYMNQNSTKNSDGKILVYKKAILGHLYIYKCSNVQIDNLAFENMLPNELYDGMCNGVISGATPIDFLLNCIRIDDSSVHIYNCYFPTGVDTNRIHVIHALNVSRSFVDFQSDFSIYHDEETSGAMPTPIYAWNGYRAQAGAEVDDYNRVFKANLSIDMINTFNCSVNTHGAIKYYNGSNGDYYNMETNADGGVIVHKPNFIN